ncbi:MAG TPA: L-threonylcarbamoyladenylate synthase [Trueperaceae bacterium]|nr:L-threonylcarbamoyladenylate synthase [Trueperaceae bacterium]
MIEVLPADDATVAVAVDALRRGRLVAFPTETVYGLGADAMNLDAVASVYGLKGRPTDHPLIVHLPAAADVWRWADVEMQSTRGIAADSIDSLTAQLWPGPLTLVLWARPEVPRAVTGGQDTVALRVPGNDVALDLLRGFGGGVVAPSANRFGRVSPTAAAHVVAEFGGADVDVLVLDGGATRLGLESTVVDLTTSHPRLLRPGSLPLSVVEAIVSGGSQSASPADRRGSGRTRSRGADRAATPRAPGTLAKHYAPATPLRLVATARLASPPADAAVIARFQKPPGSAVRAGGTHAPWVVLPTDAPGFARGLYAAIRELDDAGASVILVEEPPSGDEWLAVRDRLERAAAAHAVGHGDTGGH